MIALIYADYGRQKETYNITLNFNIAITAWENILQLMQKNDFLSNKPNNILNTFIHLEHFGTKLQPFRHIPFHCMGAWFFVTNRHSRFQGHHHQVVEWILKFQFSLI